MAVLYTPHFVQFFADDNTPLAGGKLYTYAAGTNTPKATYTTEAGNIANTNPIILDSEGRAVIFLSGSYKFALTNSSDVPVGPNGGITDNVSAFSTGAEGINIIGDYTEAVVASGDSFLFSDLSDSNIVRRDTIQGILDLAAGTLAGFQVLTASSGTYTPTTGATRGLAIAIGGGGGSGGADGVNTSASGAGGGGGGGGAAIARFTISGTVSFTVGAGGTAGTDVGGNGGNGGTTTLTGIVVATGGTGGTGSGNGGSARGTAAGGAGGIGTTGTLLLEGADGGNAKWNYTGGEGQGGEGGSAPFGGGGGRAGLTSVTGTGAVVAIGAPGNQYGGGAGGPANHSSTTGQAGEAGAQGVIYIFEFK